jgi:hypothetical protein
MLEKKGLESFVTLYVSLQAEIVIWRLLNMMILTLREEKFTLGDASDRSAGPAIFPGHGTMSKVSARSCSNQKDRTDYPTRLDPIRFSPL